MKIVVDYFSADQLIDSSTTALFNLTDTATQFRSKHGEKSKNLKPNRSQKTHTQADRHIHSLEEPSHQMTSGTHQSPEGRSFLSLCL